MSETFDKIVAQMEPLLKTLLSERPLDRAELRNIPKRGIYVLYEGGEPIYVGRSNDIPRRLREHGNDSSRNESATFAYKLSLDATGDPGGHTPGKTRKTRERDPEFAKEYQKQRKRVRNMLVRVAGIEDQATQSVFEIYAILALGTESYNKFHTT